MTGVRLDKWLWAARFFKTRALSSEEIGKGRVSVNGQLAGGSVMSLMTRRDNGIVALRT